MIIDVTNLEQMSLLQQDLYEISEEEECSIDSDLSSFGEDENDDITEYETMPNEPSFSSWLEEPPRLRLPIKFQSSQHLKIIPENPTAQEYFNLLFDERLVETNCGNKFYCPKNASFKYQSACQDIIMETAE